MTSKFRNSWELIKSSFAVIAAQPRLLAFPLLIGLFTMGLAIFFFAPLVLVPTGFGLFNPSHWAALGKMASHHGGGGAGVNFTMNPIMTAYLAVTYFVSMFFATFFNVAFYHEILVALRGGQVSISRGLQSAGKRWKAILMWTLFAGLIGYLIKALERKFGFFGRIIIGLIGLAWSVASVFAIPVLVTSEDTENPIEVLKRSAGTLRRTWGEALIGYIGLDVAGGMLVLLFSAFLLGGSLALTVISHSPLFIIIGGIAWVAAMVIYGYLMSVASQVFRGALYLYAHDQTVAGPFTAEMFDRAWKRRSV